MRATESTRDLVASKIRSGEISTGPMHEHKMSRELEPDGEPSAQGNKETKRESYWRTQLAGV
jgi:hypothetical protein